MRRRTMKDGATLMGGADGKPKPGLKSPPKAGGSGANPMFPPIGGGGANPILPPIGGGGAKPVEPCPE